MIWLRCLYIRVPIWSDVQFYLSLPLIWWLGVTAVKLSSAFSVCTFESGEITSRFRGQCIKGFQISDAWWCVGKIFSPLFWGHRGRRLTMCRVASTTLSLCLKCEPVAGVCAFQFKGRPEWLPGYWQTDLCVCTRVCSPALSAPLRTHSSFGCARQQ